MKKETYKGWEIKLYRDSIRCKNLQNDKILIERFPRNQPIFQWRRLGKKMINSSLQYDLYTAKERVVDILKPFNKESRQRITQQVYDLYTAKEKIVNILKPFNTKSRERIIKVVFAKEKIVNILKPFNPKARKRIVKFVFSHLQSSGNV